MEVDDLQLENGHWWRLCSSCTGGRDSSGVTFVSASRTAAGVVDARLSYVRAAALPSDRCAGYYVFSDTHGVELQLVRSCDPVLFGDAESMRRLVAAADAVLPPVAPAACSECGAVHPAGYKRYYGATLGHPACIEERSNEPIDAIARSIYHEVKAFGVRTDTTLVIDVYDQCRNWHFRWIERLERDENTFETWRGHAEALEKHGDAGDPGLGGDQGASTQAAKPRRSAGGRKRKSSIPCRVSDGGE